MMTLRIGGDEGEPKSRNVPVPPPAPARPQPTLRLQPNPASSWVSIGYLLPGNSASATLLVRDITGHLVEQFRVSGEEGQVNWAVQKLAAGVYSVELVRDGRTVETQRLILQP